MCTLRSFSHKPKKTCFILSFTLKLWYEQSDHKMEQSDHAMMQGLSQLYCKGTNRQQQDRRYFMTLPFSYPIKRLSVAQGKKKNFNPVLWLIYLSIQKCI